MGDLLISRQDAGAKLHFHKRSTELYEVMSGVTEVAGQR